MSGREPDRMLRWYPQRWRRRYGDELLALLEDTYGGRVPLRGRLALLRNGVAERLRESGLTGTTAPPATGVRAGTLLVLWGWAAFMVAGAAFGNLAENWSAALGRRTFLPAVGYDVTFVAGVAGVAIVGLGAAVCAASFARFLLGGGWAAVRRTVLRSAWLTGATALGVAAMATWARYLSTSQRNGSYLPYGLLAIAVAVLATAALTSWTITATVSLRRVRVAPRLVRRYGRLAMVLVAAMAALAAGIAEWWAVVAVRAPWFIGGTAPVSLVIVGVLMLAGLALGVAGGLRVAACLGRITT